MLLAHKKLFILVRNNFSKIFENCGKREMKNRPFRNFYKIIYIIFSLICIADIMLNLYTHTLF